MTSSRKILFVFVALLSSFIALGNGMGTYAISSAVRSSNPVCRQIKDITLLSEKLFINLNSGNSEVIVKYVLWNDSGKDYTDIDYAFPVDYIVVNEGVILPKINKIEFFHNDEPLDFTQSDDTQMSTGELNSLRTIHRNTFFSANSVYRRWYYTKISIKKHSCAYLEVKYSLSNLFLCDGDSPLDIPYFDLCEQHSLIYDFSPASSWGDGVIRDFYVEVNGRDLLQAGDQFGFAEEYSQDKDVKDLVRGLNFEKQNDRYVYRARNFNLKKASPLFITYSASWFNSMKVISEQLLSPEKYSAQVSNAQSKYPKSNLSDMNFESAWVGKKGDWIEISFTDSCQLAGFCLVNGYQKSAETYQQNNRVKILKIEMWSEDYYVQTEELPNEPYTPVYFENLFRSAYYYDFFDLFPNNSTKKIRFTIEDVYPGTKYDDTCISEILFFKGKDYSEGNP